MSQAIVSQRDHSQLRVQVDYILFDDTDSVVVQITLRNKNKWLVHLFWLFSS